MSVYEDVNYKRENVVDGYNLCMKDYIDLEKMIASGSGAMEQQAFLLSRFFKISLERVEKIDSRLISLMSNEMNEYLLSVEKEEGSDLLKNEIEKIKKTGKIEPIDNRFDILDL